MTEYEKKLKKFIVPVLRRATYRWKDRTEAFRAARIERGLYKCASCAGTFPNKEISLDHIIPVVSVQNGFTDWNDYIVRMFPEASGFQVLCNPCHDLKTSVEDNIRNANKKKNVKKIDKKKKVE